jgi:hypothetical protein
MASFQKRNKAISTLSGYEKRIEENHQEKTQLQQKTISKQDKCSKQEKQNFSSFLIFLIPKPEPKKYERCKDFGRKCI